MGTLSQLDDETKTITITTKTIIGRLLKTIIKGFKTVLTFGYIPSNKPIKTPKASEKNKAIINLTITLNLSFIYL